MLLCKVNYYCTDSLKSGSVSAKTWLARGARHALPYFATTQCTRLHTYVHLPLSKGRSTRPSKKGKGSFVWSQLRMLQIHFLKLISF